MKKLLLAVAALTLASGTVYAADAKSYQVTGPVLELNDTTITVQKGSEKWQINKGSATVPADVKVGSKVKIEYTMTATTVEDKSPKTPAKDAKKEAKTATKAKDAKPAKAQ